MKLDCLINELLERNHIKYKIPNKISDKKLLFDALRTVSMPVELSDDYIKGEKSYLVSQNSVDVYDVHDQLLDDIYIFQGDITTIKADAIVNAANEKLLGCFIPGHHCIDNAIHLNAGLELRNECFELMLGQDEVVGCAKVTSGYNLPATYVIHTVGPNLNGANDLTEEDVVNQLKSCYLSILIEAEKYDIRSLVFCSISTGVYGVDINLASRIALETIRDYMKSENHRLEKVVIDVFNKEDYDAYKKTVKRIKSS
jgi:O-acetyl-ADP-ribose deacetylase (regulator of RNase III)